MIFALLTFRDMAKSISRAFPKVKSFAVCPKFSMGSKFYFSQMKTYFSQFINKFLKFFKKFFKFLKVMVRGPDVHYETILW